MDKPRIAKQVIVMRTDLNMRKGKMIAQGAHASLGVWLLIVEDDVRLASISNKVQYSEDVHDAARSWINGIFTKVCVQVASEIELDQIAEAATAAGLPCKVIVDSGKTEFNGVPTKTCLAIGPAWADDIDKITGDLKLL